MSEEVIFTLDRDGKYEECKTNVIERLRQKLSAKNAVVRQKIEVKSIEEVNRCPNCGYEKLIVDYVRGEIICPNCGTVVAERIVDYTRPEYRVFTPEDVLEKERTQRVDLKAPELDLGQDEIDTLSVSPQLRPFFERIKKINKRLRITPQDRNIVKLERFVKNIVQKLGLQSVLVDDVVYMYRQLAKTIENRRMFRIRELAVALLYIACKRRGLTFRFKEILKEANISKKRFGKLVNRVKGLLQKCGIVLTGSVINESEIKAYIYRILERLNIPETPEGTKLTIAKLTLDLVKRCREAHITSGRSVHTVIAAAIYIILTILNLKRKQREIAQAAEVTDVTIRTRYKEIMDKINIVIYV